jgi:hypothetical protein
VFSFVLKNLKVITCGITQPGEKHSSPDPIMPEIGCKDT